MRIKYLIRAMLGAYAVTIALLLLLAFLLFKFDLSENLVNAGITIIYILSGFAGGWAIGKQQKSKKFLWGTLTGILYFLLLFLVSWMLEGSNAFALGRFLGTIALCMAGGMLGGMLS